MNIKNHFAILGLFMLLTMAPAIAQACNCGCGCSLSGYNPELMTTNGNNSISLLNTTRLSGMNIISDGTTKDGPMGSALSYKLVQSVTEIRGVYYPISKLALTAVLPVNYMAYSLNGRNLENHFGLGDAWVNADYTLMGETRKMRENRMTQRWSIGAGIKMPTGNWKDKAYDGTWNPQRQNGTGSVDFIFNTAYFYRYRNGGINAYVSYKANTTNTNHYRYGNTWAGQLKGFYVAKVGRVSMMPNAGLAVESSGIDTYDGYTYWQPTGGTTLSSSVGADIYYKDFGFTLSWLQTLAQQVNGVSELQSRVRLQAGLKYIIPAIKKVVKARGN